MSLVNKAQWSRDGYRATSRTGSPPTGRSTCHLQVSSKGETVLLGDSGSAYHLGVGTCLRYGWVDADLVSPPLRKISDEELADRLPEPCTPSSDIWTFISPDGYS